jgi:four helix bundle protein
VIGNGLWVIDKGGTRMSGFRDLKVWQKAKDLAVQIYKVTQDGAFGRDFGFKDQIRRASVSIPSNIAEGDERGSNKEAVRFFYIAKGSLAELQTQLEIAREIGYLDELTVNELLDRSETIGKIPNFPYKLCVKTEINRLCSIPDHQQGIRCKAPRSDD